MDQETKSQYKVYKLVILDFDEDWWHTHRYSNQSLLKSKENKRRINQIHFTQML